MTTIKIKPLSVNQAWRGGARYKTKEYLNYKKNLILLLPKNQINEDQELELNILVGLSSKQSDVDNILKPFIDTLTDKYNFNDKQIFKIKIEKTITKKGEEFISFELKDYEGS